MRVSNVDKHTNEDEIPVRLCNYVDVYYNDHIDGNLPYMKATVSPDEADRFRLKRNDVVITKDSEAWNDIAVPALVTDAPDDLICGYHLAILRPSGAIDGAYLARALQTQQIAKQLHVEAQGITRYGLTHDDILSVKVPLPPLDEQAAIVRYLDHADDLINRYISAKERLIALLEEQRQAVIHQAVTRGLDHSVCLKASGAEWLGHVPEHWNVSRARFLFEEIDLRSTTGTETHLSMSQVLGLVPSQRVEQTLLSASYVGGKLCQKGDLVLNRLKAHLGVFAVACQPGVVSPDYSIFRKKVPLEMEYFAKVLRLPVLRPELRIRSKGIVEGFWRLYTKDLFDIRLPVPPAEEQAIIVSKLSQMTSNIDDIIERTRKQIDLMNVYRTRLIADVVTGQLDVRDAVVELTKPK